MVFEKINVLRFSIDPQIQFFLNHPMGFMYTDKNSRLKINFN